MLSLCLKLGQGGSPLTPASGDSPASGHCIQVSQVSRTTIYFSDLILELNTGDKTGLQNNDSSDLENPLVISEMS